MRSLVARKPVQSLEHQAASGAQLSRSLGLPDLVGIGIGHVIGAGVFVLSGVAIQTKVPDPIPRYA